MFDDYIRVVIQKLSKKAISEGASQDVLIFDVELYLKPNILLSRYLGCRFKYGKLEPWMIKKKGSWEATARLGLPVYQAVLQELKKFRFYVDGIESGRLMEPIPPEDLNEYRWELPGSLEMPPPVA